MTNRAISTKIQPPFRSGTAPGAATPSPSSVTADPISGLLQDGEIPWQTSNSKKRTDAGPGTVGLNATVTTHPAELVIAVPGTQEV